MGLGGREGCKVYRVYRVYRDHSTDNRSLRGVGTIIWTEDKMERSKKYRSVCVCEVRGVVCKQAPA